MTEIPVATFIIHAGESGLTAPGLPEERCIRTAEARAGLPKGTITVDVEGYAVADGCFQGADQSGTLPGHQSVLLPAYIIAGPGLPALIPGGSVLADQAQVDRAHREFMAIDANGTLFMWDDTWEDFGTFAWMPVGHSGKFPRSSRSLPGVTRTRHSDSDLPLSGVS